MHAAGWSTPATTSAAPTSSSAAELGVSELVTNALLHAATPIAVRVRGTREHPRVEVSDASPEPPLLPGGQPPGRRRRPAGDLRARAVDRRPLLDAPGAPRSRTTARSSGSSPPPTPAEDGVEGVITGLREAEPRPRPGTGMMEIELHGVPLRLFFGFQMHYRELRREVRLLALANESAYPLAKTLSDHFGALDRQLSEGIGAYQIDAALRSRVNTTDLRVAIAPDGADHRRPLPGPARPRRRVLPGGAAALAGALDRAARLPALVPRRVRPPAERRAPARVARCPREQPTQQRFVTPAPCAAAARRGGGRGRARGRSPAGRSARPSRRRPASRGRRSASTWPARSCWPCSPPSRSSAATARSRWASAPACWAGSRPSPRTPSSPARCWPTAAPRWRRRTSLGTLAVCRRRRRGGPPPLEPARPAGVRGRGGQRVTAAPRRPRCRRGRAAAAPRRALAGPGLPVRHAARQRRRVVPAGVVLGAVAGRPRVRAAGHRASAARSRRTPRSRSRRTSTACAAARRTPSRPWRSRWPPAPAGSCSVRRSRGRAAGRRRCRSGGRPRARR